ncbi:sugar ABC transporter substrate-binding protein [Marinicrinis sediminis]|uniref:Maltodextrin-binding protein n=1 Tax=Marinicrinis sediminis TaxID=1652465 RepID=A0ABW5RCA4_9BACL
MIGRKSLGLLLMCVLLIWSMAACSNNENGESASNEQNENVSTSNGAENAEASPDEEAVLEAPPIEEDASLIVWDNGGSDLEWAQFVAEKFTDEYGIPVEVQEVSQSDAPTKLQTDGPAGLGADVFLAPHDQIGSLVASGLILENFYAEEYRENFLEASVIGTTMEGVLYGYPTAIDTYALIYNKDLVETPPATMDELIEQAKAFNDLANDRYGFMMEVGNLYFLHGFIAGYGGYVFGDNNTNKDDIGLNNEGTVQAAKLMQRIHEEILPLKNEDINYGLKETLFTEGKLMFDINGPWAIAALKESGVSFGVAPLPKLDNGKQPISFSGVRAYYVNAYSEYPEAASLYAKFATSEDMLLKKYELSGQLPPRKSLLENEQIKSDEIASGFLAQASSAVPMPNIPQMSVVWDPVGNAFATLWNEQSDPKPLLDAALQQIEDAISLSE